MPKLLDIEDGENVIAVIKTKDVQAIANAFYGRLLTREELHAVAYRVGGKVGGESVDIIKRAIEDTGLKPV
jgi:hypothetical protein